MYNKRVTFCDMIENDDRQGGASITPASLKTVWASVVPFNSNQTLAYNQLSNSQGYNIECRWLKTFNVSTKHGIMVENKLLSIHSLVNEEDKRLKIIAFE